jgi:hypothetical protein
MATLFRSLVLIAIAMTVSSGEVVAASQVSAHVREQAVKAMDAAEHARHAEAFEIWRALYTEGSSVLGYELSGYVRSQLYLEAFKEIESSTDDCVKVLRWVEKATAPGAPDYEEPADGFYPMLLVLGGGCRAKQGEYEEAYRQLTQAKVELRNVSGEDLSTAMSQVDRYLEIVEAHVLSAGDYVTNRGVIQMWIGEIEERRGDLLVVTVTYANEALDAGVVKGQRLEIGFSDCKRLGAVSTDAAAKGWRK